MAIQKVGGGTDFTIQNTSSDSFYSPAVTGLSDGRYALAWSDNASGSDTRTQIVGSTSSEVAFNVESGLPASLWVALDQSQRTSDIVYAWTQVVPDPVDPNLSDFRVFHSVIRPNGVVWSPPQQIDHMLFSATPGNPSVWDFTPEVATRTDGSYVVGFDSYYRRDLGTNAPTDRDINASSFDGNGKQLNFNLPFASINDRFDQQDLAIAALSGNRTVLVWSTKSPTRLDVGTINERPNPYGTDVEGTFGLRAAIYDASGNQVRDVQLVNAVDMPANARDGDQLGASVATLTNGDFVVTWTDNSLSKGDVQGTAIFARIFDPNGIPRGGSFQVNTTIGGDQTDSDVTALSGGGFAVSWTDSSGPNLDVRVRAFTADGTPTDALDQIVNTTVPGDQFDSQIAGGANNTFVVAWEDASSAPNGVTFGTAIKFQQFVDKAPQSSVDIPVILPPRNDHPIDPKPSQVRFDGDNGPNNFTGNDLDNLMFGYGGNDILNGAAGNDEIHGGNGRDFLTGGSGADTFFFDTKPTGSNYDRITDFHHNEDTLALKGSIFRKLGSSVSSSELRQGTEAHDKNDYLIYNKKNGKLYYDPDGNGDKDQVLIAQLTNKVKITASDFDIV